MIFCKFCKALKIKNDFSISYLKAKYPKCRQCCAIYKKQYYIKNKDKIQKYKKKYQIKNAEFLAEKRRIYYQKNKDKINEKNILYKKNNKNKILIYKEFYKNKRAIINKKYEINNKEYRRKYKHQYYIKNKEVLLLKAKTYKTNNKEKIKIYKNNYEKIKRKNSLLVKLRSRVSSSISQMLKSQGSSKFGDSCLKYLKYSIEELKFHLENQFENWMSWENYGLYIRTNWNDNDPKTWTWQIDHIVPQAILPYNSMEDINFHKCWSLENLRPLSSKVNILEGVNRIRHKK